LDDLDGLTARDDTAPATLPPRRAIPEKATSSGADPGQVGARIGGTPVLRQLVNSDDEFKVREHRTSVVRLDIPAPTPKKVVAFFKFRERKFEASLEGEGRNWGEKRIVKMRNVICIGLGVTVIVISCVALLFNFNTPKPQRGMVKQKILVVEDVAAETAIPNLDFLVNKHQEALAISRKYFEATQVSEILPLVRDSAKLSDLLSQKWQPRKLAGASLKSISTENSSWEMIELDGMVFGILMIRLQDASNQMMFFVREGDELRMDWKASSGYGTATFEELSRGEGDASEVRGSISRAVFYGPQLPESNYQSFRFISPNLENIVWIYTPLVGPVIDKITSIFGSGEISGDIAPEREITLHLERGPEGSAPNQWLIRDVIQRDWLTP